MRRVSADAGRPAYGLQNEGRLIIGGAGLGLVAFVLASVPIVKIATWPLIVLLVLAGA